MKITRSYWLGLGSGLILSALLALLIPLQQGQAVVSPDRPAVPPARQQAATEPPTAGETNNANPPSLPVQSTQDQSPAAPSGSPSSDQSFTIPKGVSSEQIAALLFAQNFIKDKESFLAAAHQMGVESQFRAGTYTLTQGLTVEELIHRLVKK